MPKRAARKPQVSAFLSHRYKSPAVNLYFFSILSEKVDFQFKVDVGNKPLDVTRLEIMVRDCDCFIGIYPYPGDPHAEPDFNDLVAKSQYFRLETDLALRSRKPMLLYIDKRYRPLFALPKSARVEWFDIQEVEGGSTSPSRRRYQRVSEAFHKEVAAQQDLQLAKQEETDHKIGIILAGNSPNSVYDEATVAALRSPLVSRLFHNPSIIRFPDPRDRFQLSMLDQLNWAMVDVGPDLFRTGVVGYLHGRFVPMIRMLHDTDRSRDALGAHRCLYAGIEQGYDECVIRWSTPEDLELQIKRRLAVIFAESKLIRDSKEATDYFGRASLRKEAVFLSYSGEDKAVIARLRKGLKAKFQEVFDYQEVEAIAGGSAWLEQIDIKLQGSKLGIVAVSSTYLSSEHCKQEARIMNNLRNQKKMAMVPIRISEEKLKMPAWLADLQYLRLYQYADTGAAVDGILQSLDHELKRLEKAG